MSTFRITASLTSYPGSDMSPLIFTSSGGSMNKPSQPHRAGVTAKTVHLNSGGC